jgi:hypothetical protein
MFFNLLMMLYLRSTCWWGSSTDRHWVPVTLVRKSQSAKWHRIVIDCQGPMDNRQHRRRGGGTTDGQMKAWALPIETEPKGYYTPWAYNSLGWTLRMPIVEQPRVIVDARSAGITSCHQSELVGARTSTQCMKLQSVPKIPCTIVCTH